MTLPAVLSRPYELTVRDSFASAGGPALLTCDLPSYVTGHVTVASWVRDDEFNIYPSDDTGQFERYWLVVMIQVVIGLLVSQCMDIIGRLSGS